MYAAQNGHLECTKLLLKQRAQVNACDDDSVTPLHFAASSGCLKTCEALILHGADANSLDDDGNTPFSYIPTEARANKHTRLLWETLFEV